MRVAISEIYIDVEAAIGVPGRRYPVTRHRRFLQTTPVAGGSCPSPVRLAARGHRGVSRIVDGVVDDVEAIGSVDSLPISLRGGVQFHELGRSAGGRRRRAR